MHDSAAVVAPCTFRRQVSEHVALTTQENKEAHDLDISARHLMNITAPEITYEQALELAKEYLKINAIQSNQTDGF